MEGCVAAMSGGIAPMWPQVAALQRCNGRLRAWLVSSGSRSLRFETGSRRFFGMMRGEELPRQRGRDPLQPFGQRGAGAGEGETDVIVGAEGGARHHGHGRLVQQVLGDLDRALPARAEAVTDLGE